MSKELEWPLDAPQGASAAMAGVSAALENLKSNQRQLDMDGCEVGVSRQALEELIAAYEALSTATPADVAGLVRLLNSLAVDFDCMDDHGAKDTVDQAAIALQTLSAERDALSARCGEMEKIVDDLMGEIVDAIEADMGRELRDRDLPRSWHRARAALSRRATGVENG